MNCTAMLPYGMRERFKNPLTQQFSCLQPLSLSVDKTLASLASSSNLFWKGKTDREKQFVNKVKARAEHLWTAAVKLHPKFKGVRLDFEVEDDNWRWINAFTTGYNKVRVTKDMVRAVMNEDLTEAQRLDMITSTIAHEMGHCLQRHPSRNVLALLLLFAVMNLLERLVTTFVLNFDWEQIFPLNYLSLLSCISNGIAILSFFLSNVLSREHEYEADITGMLILASYNELHQQHKFDSETTPIDLKMASYNWTSFKPFSRWHSSFETWFLTHPSNESRAQTTAKSYWILKHHANAVLVDRTTRGLFFRDTLSLSDPRFIRKWNLPESELKTVVELARPKPCLPPPNPDITGWIKA